MNTLKIRSTLLILAISLVITTSCESLKTALFDHHSYENTVAIKVETLNLLQKSTESYSDHQTTIDNLLLDIAKMVEYERNKPNNELTYQMWKIIASPDKNLAAGLLKKWKEDTKLSQVFVEEAKGQVSEAYDLLLKYETAKDKKSKENLLNYLIN